MKNRNLCIIPARGGSKRIPRKNIREFLGKPIIAYSIETALGSGLFDEVMVSTDDEEIAEIAKNYGANVPFLRSSESSDDHAILADVIEEVKLSYHDIGKNFDFICCVLPTAPLLTLNNLIKGYELLLSDMEADSVRPIVQFSYPIQRAVKLEKNRVVMFNEKYYKTRSQDLERAYHDAGQYYWMKAEKGLSGKVKLGVVIEEVYVQDIDTEQDWTIAELKYKMLKR